MQKKIKTTYSIDCGGTLFLIFLVLKLCKVIDWSWWWVTCPLWGPFAILAVFGIVFAIFGIWSSK